jgi:uncharacterized protein Smg (DUF494 family)
VVKDISADERYEYNQKISGSERQLEDYKTEEKALLEAIENYKDTMTKSFSSLDNLNQDLVDRGSRPARMDMDADQGMAQFVNTMAEDQEESISKEYSKLRQETEDEIEKLQRECDNLPWEEEKKKEE